MTHSEIGLIVYFFIFSLVLTLFYKKKWFILTEKNLFTQKLFWLSVGFPVFSFFYFGLFSWWGKTPSLNPNGYAHFYEISKFPLMILASAVPLGAIVNNIHRTIQTEKQITESEKKNRIDLYFNHFKLHTELFKQIKTTEIKCNFTHNDVDFSAIYQLHVKHPLELYRKCYPKSFESSLELNMDYINSIRKQWDEIHLTCKKISTAAQTTDSSEHLYSRRICLYFDLMVNYRDLCVNLCLGGYHSNHMFIYDDKPRKYQIFSMFYDFKSMYKALLSLQDVTNSFLDTCRNKEVNELFPLNEKIFIWGSGFIEHWEYYIDLSCIGPYQEPAKAQTAHYLSRANIKGDGGSLAAED
ncbi:hypothetical protein [Enterobacter hormaechei]|uniref:hypothetical protein n=1 Tax=Enterobacter hormaechei TaxID=158836 RepID=UPI003D1C764F